MRVAQVFKVIYLTDKRKLGIPIPEVRMGEHAAIPMITIVHDTFKVIGKFP